VVGWKFLKWFVEDQLHLSSERFLEGVPFAAVAVAGFTEDEATLLDVIFQEFSMLRSQDELFGAADEEDWGFEEVWE
jgi:hypothetical protein